MTLEGVGPCKVSCRRCLSGTLCSSVLGKTQPPSPVDAGVTWPCFSHTSIWEEVNMRSGL